VISHDTKLMKNGALEKTNRLDSHEKIAYFWVFLDLMSVRIKEIRCAARCL
jgi:hypothetical protein